MSAGGDLWYDTAKGAVQLRLAKDDRRQDFCRGTVLLPHNGSSSVVTAAFQSKKSERLGHRPTVASFVLRGYHHEVMQTIPGACR